MSSGWKWWPCCLNLWINVLAVQTSECKLVNLSYLFWYHCQILSADWLIMGHNRQPFSRLDLVYMEDAVLCLSNEANMVIGTNVDKEQKVPKWCKIIEWKWACLFRRVSKLRWRWWIRLFLESVLYYIFSWNAQK